MEDEKTSGVLLSFQMIRNVFRLIAGDEEEVDKLREDLKENVSMVTKYFPIV